MKDRLRYEMTNSIEHFKNEMVVYLAFEGVFGGGVGMFFICLNSNLWNWGIYRIAFWVYSSKGIGLRDLCLFSFDSCKKSGEVRSLKSKFKKRI